MKKSSIATVDLLNGPKLVMKDRECFLDYLKMFKDGARVKVTVETYHPVRSLEQNKVLHWYLSELSEECGMEMQDFKSLMGQKFLLRSMRDKDGEEMADENGEVMMYVPSTSSLNTSEMLTYTEKIRMFGLEFLNYELPLPDKNYKLNFRK